MVVYRKNNMLLQNVVYFYKLEQFTINKYILLQNVIIYILPQKCSILLQNIVVYHKKQYDILIYISKYFFGGACCRTPYQSAWALRHTDIRVQAISPSSCPPFISPSGIFPLGHFPLEKIPQRYSSISTTITHTMIVFANEKPRFTTVILS